MALRDETPKVARNPGPPGGYRLLVLIERMLPRSIFEGAFWLGDYGGHAVHAAPTP